MKEKNDFKNGRLGADKRRTAWDDEPDEELDEAAGFAALSSVYKKSMTGVVRKRRTTRTRIKKKRMESIGDVFFCSFVFFYVGGVCGGWTGDAAERGQG